MRILMVTWLVATSVVAAAAGQPPFGDIGDLPLAKPEDKVDIQPATPPDGAVLLFDGKTLDAWEMRDGGSAAWKMVDGLWKPRRGSGHETKSLAVPPLHANSAFLHAWAKGKAGATAVYLRTL